MTLFTIDLHTHPTTKTSYRRAVRVIIERDGKYLMITSRYGDAKFPGGGQQHGEDDLHTAARELLEETGYVLDTTHFILLGEVEERRQGMDEDTLLCMTSAYYYADINTAQPSPQQLEGYEVLYDYQVAWLTLNQAYDFNQRANQKYPQEVPWCFREMKVINLLRGT